MYVLKCNAFDNELSVRYTNRCCDGDCHAKAQFISVTPYAADATRENRSLDWTLGIQGLVCCGRYEFVRSLSREWWIRKLAIIDNWTERELIDKLAYGSWHSSQDKSRQVKTKSSQAVKLVKSNTSKCPDCGSTWNQVACDDCGYSE